MAAMQSLGRRSSLRWLVTASILFLPVHLEAKWFRMTSPHFELYSEGSQGKAKSILRYFEEVRDIFAKIYPNAPDSNRPARIIAFGSEGAFRRFRPRETAYAFYARGRERDYIVFQELSTVAMNPTAIHEYTHLQLETIGLDLPLWLSEGLAELFSTMREDPRGIAVGHPTPRFPVLLRSWLKPEVLLGTTRLDREFLEKRDKVQTLYAQGWLLAHMLYLGEDYSSKFTDFLSAVGAGETGEDAFLEVYGKTLKQMDRDLQNYRDAQTRLLRLAMIPIEWEKADEEIEDRPATELESGLVQADLLSRAGNREEAIKEYKTLAGAYPDNPEVEAGLARLAEEDEEALAHYERAAELGSQDACVYIDYATRLARSGAGDRDRVVAILRTASILDPSLNDAHLLLAAYAAEGGAVRDALDHLGRVRNLETVSGFGYLSWIGDLRRDAGDPAGAADVAKRATRFVLTLSDMEEAEQSAAGASAGGQPSRPALIDGLLSRGEYGEAAKLLRALTGEYANVPGLYTKLAEAYGALGEEADAKAQRERARKVARNNVLIARRDARTLTARELAYHETGFHERAYKIQSRLNELDPGDWLRANNHAYELAERGWALEEALELAQLADRLNPNSATILDTLGWVYVKMERHEEAVGTFERAIEAESNRCKNCRGSDNPVVQYHFGVALRRAGEEARAGRALEAALKLKPPADLEEDIREELAAMSLAGGR